MQDFRDQLAGAFASAGIQGSVPELIFDDKIHRFPTSGGPTDDSGYYCVTTSEDGKFAYGYFGCWRDDIKVYWHSKGTPKGQVNEIEKRARARRARERARLSKEATKKCASMFNGSPELTPEDASHPYLSKKGIDPKYLPGSIARRFHDKIIVAVRNENREIKSLQFLWPHEIPGKPGKWKSNKMHAPMKDGYCAIGSSITEQIVIVEGLATGVSVHQITNMLTVVAFSSANLRSVAITMRNKFPDKTIVIAGDPGKGEELADRAASAVDGLVAVPPAELLLSDWNDVLLERGMENAVELYESVIRKPGLVKEEAAPVEKDSPPAAEPESQIESEPPSNETPPKPPTGEWTDNIIWVRGRTKKDDDHPRANEQNIALYLDNHPDFEGMLCLNTFSDSVMINRYPDWCAWHIKARRVPREVDEKDIMEITRRLQTLHLDVSVRMVDPVISLVANGHPINPLIDMIEKTEWDGESRIDTWLIDYMGANDSPYVRAAGRKWLISALARLYEPGCKVDSMLVLEGDQGLGKSQVAEVLAMGREFFTDDHIDVNSKEGAQALTGKWIIEFAELANMKGRLAQTIKAFLSRSTDWYRAPYGRNFMERPRQCVFIGTTNDETYLEDITGNRRFWPVKVRRANSKALGEHRAQIWAEALLAYKAGENWFLPREVEELAKTEQADRVAGDPWRPEVEMYIQRHSYQAVTAYEILHECINVNLAVDRRDRGAISRVRGILRAMGWVRRENVRLANACLPPQWRGEDRPRIYVPEAIESTVCSQFDLAKLRMAPQYSGDNVAALPNSEIF